MALSQNEPAFDSPDDLAGDYWLDSPLDGAPWGVDDAGPSLPIVLLSAAFGVGVGVIVLYMAYIVLRWPLPASVFAAVLVLCIGLGVTGAGLTILTGSRAVLPNVTLGCGLVFATLLFFGLCVLAGAVGATLVLTR
jgi:hypothetical protein